MLLSSAYAILTAGGQLERSEVKRSSPCVLEEEAERLCATLDPKVHDGYVLEERHVDEA